MEERLHPSYLQALTASSRLTDARSAIWALIDVLPVHKKAAVVRLYNALCRVQGELETLLEDIPTVVHDETK